MAETVKVRPLPTQRSGGRRRFRRLRWRLARWSICGAFPRRDYPGAVGARHIVDIFSTTKGAASLTVSLAASRGFISIGAKVAEFWPGFAQASTCHPVGDSRSHYSRL